jgi:hypothetical protein
MKPSFSMDDFLTMAAFLPRYCMGPYPIAATDSFLLGTKIFLQTKETKSSFKMKRNECESIPIKCNNENNEQLILMIITPLNKKYRH